MSSRMFKSSNSASASLFTILRITSFSMLLGFTILLDPAKALSYAYSVFGWICILILTLPVALLCSSRILYSPSSLRRSLGRARRSLSYTLALPM